MKLSVVIPVFFGQSTIGRLVHKLFEILTDYELEIVLVDDGSLDSSHEVCLALYEKYKNSLTYVRLSKNFGEHNAVMAGLRYSTGDYAVIIDDDFQNPPEAVINLAKTAVEGEYDVVYSSYPKKQHSIFRNLGSRFNNLIAGFLLDVPRNLYLSSFKCLSRFAVNEIVKYIGPFPYIDGLILRSTRKIGTVEVAHNKRQEGKSGYTFRKLVHLWLNMFVNFSIMPLRISSILGLIFSGFGLVFSTVVVIEKLNNPSLPIGWPSLIIAFLVFAGVQLFILGLLGEYLGRLYLSSNQTPQYVVREMYCRSDD